MRRRTWIGCGRSSSGWLRCTTRSRPTCCTTGWCSIGRRACTTRSGSWRTCSCRGTPATSAAKYLEPERAPPFPADLNADYQAVTLLPPVGNDEPLVRSYLLHFFVDEAELRRVRAVHQRRLSEASVRRDQDRQRAGRRRAVVLAAAAGKYQALKERVDLDFASRTDRYFAADEPVQLDVDVKNVEHADREGVRDQHAELLSRESARGRTPTSIWTAWSPTRRQTHKYADPPLRRVRRHFEFPQLTKPGVYVVDFIGNGQSSRAVSARASLRHVVRTDHRRPGVHGSWTSRTSR